MTRRLAWMGWCVLAAWAITLGAAGCRCGGGGVGERCQGNDDCDPGLFCDPASLECAPIGTDSGTDGGAAPGDAGTDSGGDAGGDAAPSKCLVAADCDALHGPPPCGAWACNGGACDVSCPGCTIDADGDGYGPDPGCAGPDCDDADDTVFDSALASCYSGPAGTDGIGACRAGTTTCAAGAWSPCVGEVGPSGEACNGQDDDCNGAADDGLGSFGCGIGACANLVPACSGGVVGTCLPLPGASGDAACDGVDNDCDGPIDEDCACVTVAPTGDDLLAAATSNATPFATIQAAIDWAFVTPTAPNIVCVAAGAVCGATFTYANAPASTVTMADGISVYGGYESTTWTQCGGSTPASNVVIAPGTATGVVFPATVVSPTVLDDFQIDRLATSTTAGVTVDGAVNVILSNLRIVNAPAVTSSYGVNLVNGAEALVTGSRIAGGAGSSETIGVRSLDSLPTIRDNCLSLDANGRCDDFPSACTQPGICGRTTPGTGASYSVLFDDSPGATLEQSSLCCNDADTGAGVRISGDASGVTVRANLINEWGGDTASHGVWMEDCGAAAPWIVDNFLIQAAGDTVMAEVDAVRAIGDCHPVIDSNLDIVGGGEGATSGTTGVHCGADALGVASRCVVLGNLLIRGSSFGFPPTAVGVRCDGDGCMRIAGNVIRGNNGVGVWGVWLESTGAVVEENDIAGGCGVASSTGLYAADSWARLENNFIRAGLCPNGAAPAATFVGLDVLVGPGGNEIDVHSNTIDGAGPLGTCTSTGVSWGAGPVGPAGAVGIVRNNVLRGGDCGTAFVFAEASSVADPRIFEHNDLDPYSMPMALYVDEGTMMLTSAAMVNALTDFMSVGGNLDVDATFITYPTDLHLAAGSLCIGAGTSTGAPTADFEGDPRDPATPDIGADEF